MKTLLMATLFTLTACGAAGDHGSCDIHSGSQHSCADYEGVTNAAGQLDALKAGCTATSGSWSTELCTHAGAGGGCRQQQATVKTTVWYYGLTAAQVMSSCGSSGTFVAP